ncbi:MAG: ATP-binding protein [Candidatus Diapherotrites archaeon]|uniref:ATP-binding protein n=1 Tax=Candidatus Iainarchaeum sp. TaxID=3101447 RepID=A0A2D6M1Z9_9ARCH|nr:ATP-binding protein [Candidatus Diapherotrites archaeon]|tara:strand:+ start:1633 stop:2364 length:732 start_codon:yes stop_codon:yes gene_type:complete
MPAVVQVNNVSKVFKLPLERKQFFMQHITALLHGQLGYRKLEAVKNVGLEFSEGETIALIGANGSGKTTLLKLIAGILVPTTGSISVIEKSASLFGLGVGIQEELTARENVFLYSALLGFSRKQVKEQFSKIIEFAELEEFVDVKLKQFSSGMRMRLAFSTAIHSDAELFLIDEVFSVGDEHFQKKCLDVFKELQKEGKTIVLVSHNMEHVKKFCGRAVWIEEGIIKRDGKPAGIIKDYVKQS